MPLCRKCWIVSGPALGGRSPGARFFVAFFEAHITVGCGVVVVRAFPTFRPGFNNVKKHYDACPPDSYTRHSTDTPMKITLDLYELFSERKGA